MQVAMVLNCVHHEIESLVKMEVYLFYETENVETLLCKLALRPKII